MTDQDQPQPASSAADWDAIARLVAREGSEEALTDARRSLERNPARASLVNALESALRAPAPRAPTPAEVEMALASVLIRREDAGTHPESRRAPVVSLDAYRSRWRDGRLRAAAAVILVAGAGLLVRSAANTRVARDESGMHFATAVGVLDSLRLPDGTSVLLGPGSDLTLASGYRSGTRELTLEGEAQFDVVHDTGHPFVVHTASATFRDVGTVFSVHSDAADGARIVVTSGAVSVETPTGSAPVALAAGDRASVAPAGALKVERAAATSDDTAWTTGRLVFRDASLAQVTADLRRWYGIDLQVDPAFEGHRVSVMFDRGAANDVGRVLAAILGGGLRMDGGTMHIVAQPSAVQHD